MRAAETSADAESTSERMAIMTASGLSLALASGFGSLVIISEGSYRRSPRRSLPLQWPRRRLGNLLGRLLRGSDPWRSVTSSGCHSGGCCGRSPGFATRRGPSRQSPSLCGRPVAHLLPGEMDRDPDCLRRDPGGSPSHSWSRRRGV